MTTITIDRAVVEEALEALIENARLLGATQAKKDFGCYSQEDARLERAWHEGIAKHSAALRAALAQQAEPVEPVDVGLLEYRGNSVAFIHQKMTAYRTGIDAAWDAFRANGLHPDGKTSLADMIANSAAPPKAEPVQEPVAWRYKPMIGSSWSLSDDGYYISCKRDKGYIVEELHTVLSQRTMVPLTDEEILAAVGWERAAMYMKLTPNFPVDEAKKETLTNARAVEKASWEKNHGQA